MKKEYLTPAVNSYECNQAFCLDASRGTDGVLGTDFGDNNWGDLIPEDKN